jgi:hypothetical protein
VHNVGASPTATPSSGLCLYTYAYVSSSAAQGKQGVATRHLADPAAAFKHIGCHKAQAASQYRHIRQKGGYWLPT